MRPSVRPGATLLRRDGAHLQVGTNPGIVIRDRPGLYPFLLSLNGARDVAALRRHARQHIPELTDDVVDVLAPLLSSGAVVDLATPPARPLRVAVAHHGHATPFAESLSVLLGSVGIAVGPEPEVTIIVTVGEPDRGALADAVRCRVNHLPVTLEADRVHVGPLVVPGQTPCVGCADLQRAAWDPTWLSLVPQFGRPLHGTAVVGDTSPAAVLMQRVAVIEVADYCVAFSQGHRGNDVRTVDRNRRIRVTTHAAFHPQCPCALLTAA